MESKQLSSTGMKNDFENVKKVVELIMGGDIFANNRRRIAVETRMMMGSILRDMNYSLNEIGRYMKKDHSTIIHYVKTLDNLIESDQVLLKKYIKCRELLTIKEQPAAETELFEDYRMLKLKVELLEKEKEVLIQEKKDLMIGQNVRMNNIFRLIEEHTNHGTEFLMERKLRKIFNG